jgi:hypothetical protein
MITLVYFLDYPEYWEIYHYSVYKLFPSHTSTNALSSLERRVIIVLLNKSKTNTFKKINSPPCGGHMVIYDVGQHQK